MENPWRDESKLRELYYGELLDQSQIAERLGCSRATIKKWFNKHEIKTRSRSEVIELSHKKNSNEKPWSDEETLKQLYYEDKMSTGEIAEELGCTDEVVRYWMEKHGLERRNLSEASKNLAPTFYTNKDGYEMVCNSNAMYENCDEVRVHRLVALLDNDMESVSQKVVHHKNGIKWDNRPKNLELLSNDEHGMIHQEEMHDIDDTSYRDKETLEELYINNNLSMKEIAEKFDVGAMTIRKWLIKTGVHPDV